MLTVRLSHYHIIEDGMFYWIFGEVGVAHAARGTHI